MYTYLPQSKEGRFEEQQKRREKELEGAREEARIAGERVLVAQGTSQREVEDELRAARKGSAELRAALEKAGAERVELQGKLDKAQAKVENVTALWRVEEKKVLQVQVELEKAREAVRGAEKKAMEAKTEAASQLTEETERERKLQRCVDELEAELDGAKEGMLTYKEGHRVALAEVKKLQAEVAGLGQGLAYQQTVVQQWGQQQTPTHSRITGTQWDACCTADGKMYYVDTGTGKTQWELPLQVMRTA